MSIIHINMGFPNDVMALEIQVNGDNQQGYRAYLVDYFRRNREAIRSFFCADKLYITNSFQDISMEFEGANIKTDKIMDLREHLDKAIENIMVYDWNIAK